MVDYGGYANLANTIVNTWNAYSQGKRQLKEIQYNYDFLSSQYQSDYNKVLIDYGASNAELQLQGSYLLGQKLSLESNSGIVNYGLKTNPVRTQQIQLLQLRDNNINDLLEKQEYLNETTRRQFKATAKTTRASVISGIVSSVTQGAMLLI
jgi:hypothetical protein